MPKGAADCFLVASDPVKKHGPWAVAGVIAGLDRFACNLRPGGATSIVARGGATVGTCSTTQLFAGWWKLDVTGELPTKCAGDPVFIAVVLAEHCFSEDYKDGGRSGILVGKVAFAQLKTNK